MGTKLTEKTATNRLPYLDYARVFTAYLVILGHLLSVNNTSIRPYIYSFHMPFFFLVSGMLHKDRGGIAWNKYWKTLIIPFLFFNILFFILWPILWKTGIWGGGPSRSFDDNASLGNIYLYYIRRAVTDIFMGKGGPDGPTWFLLALFYCKLANDMLCYKRIKTIVGISLILGTVGIAIFPHINYFQIGSFFMVFPFFYGGFCFKKQIQQWCNNKYSWIIGFCLFLLVIPATMINGRVTTLGLNYGQCMPPLNVIVFYINAFTASLGLLTICVRFKQHRFVTKSAKALITILCVHGAFVFYLRSHAIFYNYISYIITSFIILVACIGIHQLFEHFIPSVIGKKGNHCFFHF